MANNVKSPPFSTVVLDRFLGLFSEADPSSLPEGASPLSINDDFVVGGVLQRPGKQNVYAFSGSFSENLTELAVTVPDGHAPNEQPWSAPDNAAGNTPGTYAAVTLNATVSSPGSIVDTSASNTGTGTPASVSAQPSNVPEVGILLTTNEANNTNTNSVNAPTDGTWTGIFSTVIGAFSSFKQLSSLNLVSPSQTLTGIGLNGNQHWVSFLALFGSNGLTPVFSTGSVGNIQNPGPGNSLNIAAPLTPAAGTVLMACLSITQTAPGFGTHPQTFSISDTAGNTWVILGTPSNSGTGGGDFSQVFFAYCANPKNQSTQVKITQAAGDNNGSGANTIAGFVGTATNLIPTTSTPSFSQALDATEFGFGFSASTSISGLQVEIFGHQTSLSPDAIITVNLLMPNGTLSPKQFTAQLGTIDGETVLATASENWGVALSPALLNNPAFGVQILAQAPGGELVNFSTYAVKLKAFFSSSGLNFNYLKTFEHTDGEIKTLALDNTGTIWQEDAVNNPGILSSVFTNIEPGTFAESATLDDREFIAFSNLLNGTDIPRTYDGVNFDRLSQVGPGAPPSASATSAGSAIVSITQNAAVPLLTGSHDWLLVSDSPSDHGTFGTPPTPGNVMTLVFRSATTVPSYITPGSNIVLAGFPTINGFRVNNDPTGVAAPKFYTVSSVGLPVTGQASYDAIVFTVPFTTFYNQQTPAGCTFQATQATMTTAAQVPNLEVGSQFQVSGTGGAPPSGYDNTWLVLQTPNASQLQITSTVLNGNVATFGFNIVTGAAPTVGEFVSVSGTLNGNGIFNVTNAIISSATAGTFSVGLQGANIASAAETGAGIIFGTIFVFDAFAIIGNKTGGTIVTAGVIAAGVRKICYSFLTRNGFLTQPSPIFTFDVTSGASAIAVANLLTGPPNVIARVIHLTPADGDNFYNIPEPVTVLSNGVNVVNSSTYVIDNTTTGILLSFSDDVLTGATSIDTEGNNLFENVELGAPIALVPYAERVFAIGEQNKIPNLLNYSFDGGVQVTQGNAGAGGGAGSNARYPAGWTVDPTFGAGSGIAASPIFGSAYSISYPTGGTSGTVGMITQNAAEDEFEVAIVNASTTYSVRVTVSASITSGNLTGNLVVDLFSPSTGRVVGSFTLPLSQTTTQMAIFTGTLLTTTLAPVPEDLRIRLYATGLTAGTTILVDRIEPFPTQQPNLSTQIIGSYQGNFEAFDRVSGVVNVSVQNQQPVKSAFTLFDTLYTVKSGSIVSTQDNKTTEPAEWSTPRVISNVVGTPSVYGVAGVNDQDSGEEYAVIAHQSGAYIFNGGEPVKFSEEIQGLWNQINWAHGETVWVKNDVTNRRILFGVPLKTPNKWLPTGIIPDNPNPTTPNVILAVNYKFLNTAGSLEDRPEVHVSSFGGKLISIDMSRKWSIWTVKAPCAAFIKRVDTTAPLFVGNSDATGKIYQLVDGLLQDDGLAIYQTWISHGFVTPEQEQGLQLGSVRKVYEYMSLVLLGTGDVTMTAYPDSLTSPYAHALLPDLILPATTSGDVEVPVNEVGNRLFLQFTCNAVGAGFILSRIVMALRQDPYSPVRGTNV